VLGLSTITLEQERALDSIMAREDNSEVEILSEPDTGPYDLPSHIGTKAGLPDTEEEKHDFLVRAEQRCKEPNCPSKTLQLAAQPVQRKIGLRHNWASKKLANLICTGLYEYALNIVNLYRTESESTSLKIFFYRVVQNSFIRIS
jgi:hypothetical protein